MKFCPTCETRYDEEILRFCTKDGTPLVDENQPNFVAMPSESLPAAEDDLNEETIVRYKPSVKEIPPVEDERERSEAPRIVISTNETRRAEPPPAAHAPQAYQQPPPQKQNTAKVVALTVLGTLGALALALGLFYFLSDGEPAANTNVNVNTNPPADANLNTNLNVNLGNLNLNTNINANANANFNANFNANANANANLRSPTPTRTPTPTPTPDANANTDANSNVNAAPPVNARPTASPTATPATRPDASPTAPASNRPVNLGVVNGRAVNLPKPAYPSAARQARAAGQVAVQVFIDESGNVVSARATTGHPLLRQPAEAAARQTKFNPYTVNSQPVAATGILLYNFIN